MQCCKGPTPWPLAHIMSHASKRSGVRGVWVLGVLTGVGEWASGRVGVGVFWFAAYD